MDTRSVGGALLAVGLFGAAYRGMRTVLLVRRVVPLHTMPAPAVHAAAVTVIVPARDEAAVLDECLQGIRAQSYRAAATDDADRQPLRIVVVDDGSTDATGQIARRHAERDPRVHVVRIERPPPGWTSKVHAMHAGVQAVGPPEPGEWLMFVDADVGLAATATSYLLSTAQAAHADLVSTPGGPPASRSLSWPLLIPPGLQLIAENASPDGRGRKAFAIGHCILLRRAHYDKMGGWPSLRSRRNEDIAIATAVRDHGGTTRIVDGLDQVTTVGMDPFWVGWRSFRKSFTAGMGASAPLLIGAGLGQIGLSLIAPASVVLALHRGQPALSALGLLAWFSQSAAHWTTAKLMRTQHWLAPLAPVTGALFGVLLLDGARQVLRGTLAWRGRNP